MTIDNRKDYLLLLLYSGGSVSSVNEPVVGRTRLVKMLFLFKQELLEKFKRGVKSSIQFYEFFPWNFGPFSKQVYDDLKFFQLRKFIATNDSEAETSPESVAEWEYLFELERGDNQSFTEYVEQSFSLTEKGCQFTKQIFESLTNAQKQMLREFKMRTSSVPLRALLRYVYSEYPEQTTKSKIKDGILEEK